MLRTNFPVKVAKSSTNQSSGTSWRISMRSSVEDGLIAFSRLLIRDLNSGCSLEGLGHS